MKNEGILPQFLPGLAPGKRNSQFCPFRPRLPRTLVARGANLSGHFVSPVGFEPSNGLKRYRNRNMTGAPLGAACANAGEDGRLPSVERKENASPLHGEAKVFGKRPEPARAETECATVRVAPLVGGSLTSQQLSLRLRSSVTQVSWSDYGTADTRPHHSEDCGFPFPSDRSFDYPVRGRGFFFSFPFLLHSTAAELDE